MDYRARIKLLLSLPSYRMRLAFFVVLGGTMILASYLVSDPFWKDILVQFAVVFIAVGLIDFVWDFLGGTPIELQMTRALSDVDAKLDSVHRSMTVLSDIVDRNIGIERIWPNRRAWASDSFEGREAWKERVCQAKSVDIVSNTLWNGWFNDEGFRKRFFDSLARGMTGRIVIYDPNSDVLSLRAANERDPTQGRQMRNEIESTLQMIAKGREGLKSAARKNLQVRLTTNLYHLAQIVRADDKMLVAMYLSGKSGGHSLTFQLKGPHTEYFKTYMKQIDILWKDCKDSEDCADEAQDVDDNAIRQILAEVK